MTAVSRSPRLHRPISFVLALALLLASTLGLVHGTLHAPAVFHVDAFAPTAAGQLASSSQSANAPAHAEDEIRSAAAGPHAWLFKLFDHHEGSDQCRLYDLLSGNCSPPGVPLAVLAALALPQANFSYFHGLAPQRPSAPFDARAPPTAR